MDEIISLVKKYSTDFIGYRRRFHQYPELGGHEVETSKFIVSELENMGIEVKTGFAKTGIQGMIYGNNPYGKTIMIRADMDALPIEEETDLDFKSKNKGIMHACGHDVNTAVLLGAAKVLSEMKDDLNGNVKLCFQPAEETSGGADLMVADGIMNNPKVDYVIGMHADSSIKLGQAAIEGGPISSYPRFFEIKFKGKGGHGSFPSKSIDPILPAVKAYSMINSIVKKVSPLEPCVIQICYFNAGTAVAAIPNEASIGGTVRTLNKEIRDLVEADIRKIIKYICDIYNVESEFKYGGTAQPVINAIEFVDKVKNSVKDIFEEGFVTSEAIKLASDDFCWYCDHAPSTYMQLGSSTDNPNTQYPPHNPKFDVDERLIEKGVSAFVKIAVDYLNGEY